MKSLDSFVYKDDYKSVESKCRRKFTPEEDEALKRIIYKIGSLNWAKISQFMPGRNAKQCRDRYCNYLSQPHRIEKWQPEEDDILLQLLSIIGPKWVEISRHIPGRSGNDVKNRWYKHLCKKYSNLKEKFFIPSSNIRNVKEPSFIADTPVIDKKSFEDIIGQYKISALLI